MTVKKVLLAEDEEDIRRLAHMSLSRGGSWEILVARDGEECLALARAARPDVILLDAKMPRLDGYEACQRLKADPVTAAIPIIFLTASVQEHETHRGLALGAIGYLTKPFDPLKLRAQVVDLLQRAGLEPDTGA
ncbi:MAG: response regulator [Terriglobia bacterium]